MRDHYNVTADAKRTVVAGSSFGGIAAMYAGLRHPEVFGNVLCQSGSFWWAPNSEFGDASIETNSLAKGSLKSPRLPLRFWMDAGVLKSMRVAAVVPFWRQAGTCGMCCSQRVTRSRPGNSPERA